MLHKLKKWGRLLALLPLAIGCVLATQPDTPVAPTKTAATITISTATRDTVTVTPAAENTATPAAREGTPSSEDAKLAGALPQGVIAGIVQDANGVVPNARVRVKLTDYLTLTSDDGTFQLTGLPFTEPVSVTAWADGYFVGYSNGAPGGVPITITLKPLYTTDNLDYNWFEFDGVLGSASCAQCHPSYGEWVVDAHGQSAQNPRFITMYEGTDVYGNRSPRTVFDKNGYVPPDPDQPYYGPGVKTDYPDRAWNCAACHTPLASKLDPDNTCGWSGCHSEFTASASEFVPQGVEATDLEDPNAQDGIGCDFCHKIGDVYINPKTGMPDPDRPGILSMRLYRPEEGQQLFFGTFDDVTRRVSYLPLEEESTFCASCHYGVFSGVVAPGEMAGGVVIYNSYGEWLHSPYSDPETGKTCQDCHMPTVDYNYFVYPEKGGLIRSADRIHNHDMPGASDPEFLQSSVTMTTTTTAMAGKIEVQVNITNDNTGHDVPTGAPQRHLILVVRAVDKEGKVLPLTDGPQLPDWTGNYAGQPGEVYAKVLRDEWSGEVPTAAYWREITLISDNRIAPFETATTHYTFALPTDGDVTVEATLWYRRAFQKLAELKGWDDPDIMMAKNEITVSQ